MLSSMKLIISILFLLSTSLLYQLCNAYSSAEKLKITIALENMLVSDLRRYIREEKQKINEMTRYLETQQEQYNVAKQDVESYLGNPINSFKLIKRLVVDWRHLESLTKSRIGEDFLKNVSEYKSCTDFPSDQDLDFMSYNLINLQKVYDITAHSMANGDIGDRKYYLKIDGSGCYEIGKQAERRQQYRTALTWMQEAYILLKKRSNVFVNIEDVIEDMMVAAYEGGLPKLAMDYINQLLKLSPSHSRALHYLAKLTKSTIKHGVCQLADLPKAREKWVDDQTKWLCRLDKKFYTDSPIELKCRYINNGNPFLLIAPFKMEELSDSLDMFIVHDIISDKEIEMMKRLSVLNLTPALISIGVDQKYRNSNTADISHNKDKLSIVLARRLEDMSGLYLRASEPFQVINYGSGGFYKYHHDYLDAGQDRLATVIVYMSDVEQGGATIFPYFEITVWPRKGSAIFWRNLDPEGGGVIETLHAGCPVLVGSKWVLTQWISIKGQREENTQRLARLSSLSQIVGEITQNDGITSITIP